MSNALDERTWMFVKGWITDDGVLAHKRIHGEMYPLIHIITVRDPAKFSADPVEIPSAFRADMGSRRRTTHRDILHKILLIAFRTTVTFHPVICEFPWY